MRKASTLPAGCSQCLYAFFRIVSLYLANRHKRSKGIQQVLLKGRTRHFWIKPVHSPIMAKTILVIGCKNIIGRNFAYRDGRLVFEWHYHKVALSHTVDKSVNLAHSIDDFFRLFVRSLAQCRHLDRLVASQGGNILVGE